MKIEAASGARIEIRNRWTDVVDFHFHGDSSAIERGTHYCNLVLEQAAACGSKFTKKQHSVPDDDVQALRLKERIADDMYFYMNFTENRSDLSVVEVPDKSEIISYITGIRGSGLRSMEEDWGTLMFFARELSPNGTKMKGPERLCIFGPRRARRGAELQVMQAIEYKHKRAYTNENGTLKKPLHQPGDDLDDDWGYDTMMLLNQSDYAYCVGPRGATRAKIRWASSCIVFYVDRVVVFAGTLRERRLAREYLDLVLQQHHGKYKLHDYQSRDDCLSVEVPTKYVAHVTGRRGLYLRKLERDSGTFCFFNADKGDLVQDPETFLILAASEHRRCEAKNMLLDKLERCEDRSLGRRDRRAERSRARSYDRCRSSPPVSRQRSYERSRSRYRESRGRCGRYGQEWARDREWSRSRDRDWSRSRGLVAARVSARWRSPGRPRSPCRRQLSPEFLSQLSSNAVGLVLAVLIALCASFASLIFRCDRSYVGADQLWTV
eukprot:gnl/TRDRNA2_/TRDRNA2_166882_c0_seq3.p1 gnl/TRDRNA2_/TRDRNA2_166882_c0~~gnl/TRDRNA2_/TRDRNA2_166882_c0_seq3.p1  ORF type:complete len:493 (-),score=54.77 gnl/TRDRNA2_/TRDRNA2_166882_c0_seq3:98-1576(-)